MELSLPAFAQRVTVFGSTRKSAATSAGVRSVSPEDWSRFMEFLSSFQAARRVRRAALCLSCTRASIGPVPLRRQWPVVTVFDPPGVSTSCFQPYGAIAPVLLIFGRGYAGLDLMS